jgi:ABC-type transport system involved in cytochrome bd biosynthesis fused ATPase/permease subunit
MDPSAAGSGAVRARLRDADLVQRMVADVEAVQDLLLRCLLPAAVAWAVGATAVGVGVALLPAAGAVLAAGVLLAGAGLPVLAALASRASARRMAGARVDLAVRGLDVAQGATDLAAFGATGRFVARADAVAARLERLERRDATVEAVIAALGMAVQGLTALAVLWTAGRQDADGVLVTVLTLTALVAVESVLPVTDAARRLTAIRPAARRGRAWNSCGFGWRTATRWPSTGSTCVSRPDGRSRSSARAARARALCWVCCPVTHRPGVRCCWATRP